MEELNEYIFDDGPDWGALDWIRPGIRGTVRYHGVTREAFRSHDTTILFWWKSKWHWASARVAKSFETTSSD